MNIGIVGHEAAKFTLDQEDTARRIIRRLLKAHDAVAVSGHCPLGGIDIWAEEEAEFMRRRTRIFPPKANNWNDGYKPRNIEIAKNSDEMHVIVVAKLPENFRGRRFEYCYHCQTRDHVKSGGCWTAFYWQRLTRRKALWHVIQ